jgi:hypothetical protein
MVYPFQLIVTKTIGVDKMKALARLSMFLLVLTTLLGAVRTENEVKAQSSGWTYRVSVKSDGSQSDGQAQYPVMTPDGKHILFLSDAKDLDPRDTNNFDDLYIHNAETGTTELVTVSYDGSSAGNYDTMSDFDITPDGKYVVIASQATNLINDPSISDGLGSTDVFRKNMITGAVELVTISFDGTFAANGGQPSISDDGRYIAFTGSDYIVDDDTNNVGDVFLRDMDLKQTIRISLTSDGKQSWQISNRPEISGNGTVVVFNTYSSLVTYDTNGNVDVYAYENGSLSLVSVSSNRELGNNNSHSPQISFDGSRVVFQSLATNFSGVPDINSGYDVFARDRTTGTTTLVSVSLDGLSTGNDGSGGPSISTDGRYVTFTSRATNLVELVGTAMSNLLFIRDMQQDTTEMVSLAYDGSPANQSVNTSWSPPSADGQRIAFASSADNLIEELDYNDKSDIFVRDRAVASDTTPPAAILDLVATAGSTSGTVDLSWTAPGDDGTTGTATSYIVRYWDYPIGTELGWASATDVDGEPTSQAAGNIEAMRISGLTPGQTYYFMVRAEDEVGNLSSLGNSPSAEAFQPVDLGFRPDTNGYRFANRQFSRSWNMFEQLFSSDNVTKSDGSRCLAANQFFQTEFLGVANGWSCVGFSLTSLISYLDFSQPQAGPFAVAHYDELYQQSESTHLTNPIAYYSGIQTAQQWGNEWYQWNSTCDSDPNEMVERIRRGIQDNSEVILSLNTKTNIGWHALAPYRIEDVSASIVDVYVYDSEVPGQEKAVRFQKAGAGWQWQYTFVGSVGSAGTKTGGCADMYPYSLRTSLQQGIPTQDFCSSSTSTSSSIQTSASDRVSVLLPVEGDWIIKDEQGRRLGWVNGDLISEIPDAYYVPSAAPVQQRTLTLPAAPYTVEIENSPTTSVEYTIFGDGRFIETSAQLLSHSSSKLSVSANMNQAILSNTENLASFSLMMDSETAADSRLITIAGIPMSGNGDLNANFDGDRLEIARANGDIQYAVSFRKNDGQTASFEQLTLNANDTHIVTPEDWFDLSSDIILEIDRSSDGTVDETVILNNQGNKVYLPLILK